MNAEERNSSFDTEKRMLVEDILHNIQNDMPGINQTIQVIEPATDNELFYEDVYKKDRLNADIDINDDSRIRSILGAISTIDDQKYTNNIDKAFIRKIRDSELHLRMHLDGGANRSVTDDLRLLNNVRSIPKYTMHGAQKGEGDIICTKIGYIKLMCRGRGVINVRTFYSPNISETILSPGDITKSPENTYDLWEQRCDHLTGKGYIRFSSHSGLQHATVDTRMINGLWYASQPLLDCIHPNHDDWYETPETITPMVRRLSKAATHELWHQRLCYPGETVTKNISRVSEGVPNLCHGRNHFYRCDTCMRAKMAKIKKSQTSIPSQVQFFTEL